MITYLIPYITVKSPWWVSIDLFNYNSYSINYEIVILENNNQKSIEIGKILPFSHIIVPPKKLKENINNKNKRASIIINVTDENIYPTIYEGRRKIWNRIHPQKIENQKLFTGNIINNTEWLEFHGKNSCKYLKENYLESLLLSCKKLWFDYPKNNYKIYAGDACPQINNCQGHPTGSHSYKKNSVDLDYITFNNNGTQYGPNIVDLYNSSGNLNGNIFDWKSNYLLWKNIYSRNDITGFVDERIYNYIKNRINDSEELRKFYKYIQSDGIENYNHHKHIHIKFE